MAGKKASGRDRFGAVLHRFRAAANLTQEELAERAGLSVQAIGALERGDRRYPRPSTVELLAEALKLDAAQKDRLIASARRQEASEPQPDQSGSSLLSDAPADLADAHALLA